MIAQYKLDNLYIIKINDRKYYYGNGDTINAFSFSANTFLRFNPYMEDADGNTPIPEKIIKWIKSHASDIVLEEKVYGVGL